jgi:hypothetical protein
MGYIGNEVNYRNVTTMVATGDGSDTTPIAALDYSVPTANAIIVTLDGVTQVPNVDYNVSDTTLTFTTAPANGVNILVLFFGGTSIGIGTPADGTVTNAKMASNSVDSAELIAGAVDDSHISEMAGNKLTGTVIAKGDSGSSTDGKITLNCSHNTHGVSIQSPVHGAAANYTLTLPTTDGNADELLQTDGAGVLSWAVDSGGGPSLGTDHVIRTNKTEINENITFPVSAPFYNGSSVGPITITGSYTVTVPAGNTYTII